MHHATILVAILAFVPLASATAQVRPGERVRVTHLPCTPNTNCVGPRQKSVGTLMSVSGDSLLLSTDGGAGPVFLPLISVSRIQVLRGLKPARGRGAIIGALAGGVIGLVGGLTTYDESSDFFQFGRGGTAAVSGLVFGGLGAVVGSLVGNFFTVDRWVDVPHDRLRGERREPPPADLVVQAVVLNPAADTLQVGERVQLSATAYGLGGVAIPNQPFRWSSSNDAIASVNNAGLVTAHASGTVVIAANTNNVVGTANIVVASRR